MNNNNITVGFVLKQIRGVTMNIIKRIAIIFIVAIAVYLLTCQFIVYPVDKLVEGLFYSTEQTEHNTQIKEYIYDKFGGVDHERYEDKPYTVILDMHRVFALYFINTGYVWYKYSCFVYQNGEQQEGEADVSYRVKIKIENGRWTIVDTHRKISSC